MSESPQQRRVLLTGAAGKIGTAFWQDAGARYDLRLADRDVSSLVDSGHEALAFDIADLDACQRACEGIDIVVHLAADPSPRADFYGSLLDNNIKGTYNIFRAAKDQGCQRVVYASSIQSREAYPLDTQIAVDSPVRPANMYGVTKCFGEATAAYFAYAEGLSSIAVRIGGYEGVHVDKETTARALSVFVSRRDLVQLLVRCVETPDVLFAIVHGISNNRFKRLSIDETRALLGYAPQDDAFRIKDVPLRDTREW